MGVLARANGVVHERRARRPDRRGGGAPFLPPLAAGCIAPPGPPSTRVVAGARLLQGPAPVGGGSASGGGRHRGSAGAHPWEPRPVSPCVPCAPARIHAAPDHDSPHPPPDHEPSALPCPRPQAEPATGAVGAGRLLRWSAPSLPPLDGRKILLSRERAARVFTPSDAQADGRDSGRRPPHRPNRTSVVVPPPAATKISCVSVLRPTHFI
jgi:hypothetical protein